MSWIEKQMFGAGRDARFDWPNLEDALYAYHAHFTRTAYRTAFLEGWASLESPDKANGLQDD